ncbi:unnamed protein product, partial [Discosporangium mesarthrocarpum]
ANRSLINSSRPFSRWKENNHLKAGLPWQFQSYQVGSGKIMHQGSVSRTGYATDVILNVYDLHPMNEYGYAWGMGAFHSGVEIAGREYTFAGGGGIFDHAPRGAPNARFREAVKMGSYRGGTTELNRALDALREEFAPDRYNVLSRNCNSFSSALCEELLGRPAPGWVNRLAWMGEF